MFSSVLNVPKVSLLIVILPPFLSKQDRDQGSHYKDKDALLTCFYFCEAKQGTWVTTVGLSALTFCVCKEHTRACIHTHGYTGTAHSGF